MTERQTPRRQDAKPQGIDRRAFVTLGLGSGAAALLAACGWDGGKLVRPGLWSISRVNDWVGEKILYSPTRLARTDDSSEQFNGGIKHQLRGCRTERWGEYDLRACLRGDFDAGPDPPSGRGSDVDGQRETITAESRALGDGDDDALRHCIVSP